MAADAGVGGGLLMEVTAVTHRGNVRSHNEDTIVVNGWTCGDSMDAPRRSSHGFEQATLVLVADGMGGHVGGCEASRRAAQGLVRLIAGDAGPSEVAAALRTVNRELFAAAAKDPALRGMGTTVAGILATADRTIWFNVGDSRVYSVRQEFLRQLSVDDVPAGGAAGGRITQALGGADAFLEIEPHVGSESTRAGRRYLLCSDGLTDALPLDVVERVLSADNGDLVGELLDSALAAGAPDNVSIVLAGVRSPSGDTDGPPRDAGARNQDPGAVERRGPLQRWLGSLQSRGRRSAGEGDGAPEKSTRG